MDVEVIKIDQSERIAFFVCPGCKQDHGVWVNKPNPANQARWKWNGSKTKPTFSPSILIPSGPRCHSFVEDGMIRFLNDCDHELAGKTVPLEEWK